MEGLTVTAFAMSMIGIGALVSVIILTTKVEKLVNTLKEKGILEEDYKAENAPNKSTQSQWNSLERTIT